MQIEIFVLTLGCFFMLIFNWAFKNLPKENWQILACIPVKKINEKEWKCINLTYYGLITSLAYGFSVITFFFLLSSVDIGVNMGILTLFLILIFSLPASKIIAEIVEKKKNGFSVGAASFVGVIIAPFVVKAVVEFMAIDMRAGLSSVFMSALIISYSLGEGIGRLACISFGCCYGKAIDENPQAKKLFKKINFVFWGKTKKYHTTPIWKVNQ